MPKEPTHGKELTTKQVLAKIILLTLIMLKWFVIVGIVCCFIGGGAAVGYVAALTQDDPVRSKDFIMEKMEENSLTGFVYFNDGTPVGQLRTEEDRRMATLDEIPQLMQDAVIAVEDNDFYTHHGVDIKGTLRAVMQKLLHEPVQTGGSTITQQLARRVFLTLDREDSRKAKEIFLSLRMERLLSKDQILLAYMNKVPYGNGSTGYNLYGIKAAAKGLFNINDLNELNVAEAAFLAGLPQQPSNFSSFTSKGEFDETGFTKALNRQRLVLLRMLEENKIDRTQYDEAMSFDLKGALAEPGQKAYNVYPYLMLESERQATDLLLAQQFPDLAEHPESNPDAYNQAKNTILTQMLHEGYHIHTTIDKKIYDSMQEIARNADNFTPDDPKKGVEQIGAVMLDNSSSAVLGMIEGRDFFTEQLNHATQALRQPGSSMKPIAAYIPAIEAGRMQPGEIIDDVPIVLKDGQKGFHIPENWDGDFHGLITARRALNQSYNIPAIKLFLNVVGIDNAWDYAKRMGIHSITKEDYYAQTGVIGGLKYGVSVIDLSNAYATIANHGVFNPAYMISKITDSNGNVIFEHQKKPQVVFSEQTAYLMTDMMRTVITSGTATDLMSKFKHYKQVAIVGKTGSTQDDADAWFMGYTPNVTLGVWAGYDQPVYKLSKATGGTSRAKDVWALSMDAAINEQPQLFPDKQFVEPEGIIKFTVSSMSGKLPNDLVTESGRLVTDLFNKSQIPTEEDDAMVKMNVVSYQDNDYIPQQTTPADMMKQKIVVKREKSVAQILKEVDDAQQQLPEKDRKPLNHYIPNDYKLDAPTDVDPRVDDGQIPIPPNGVVLSHNDGEIQIDFDENREEDIVGYRLYRSMNGEPFQRVNGKVVLTGDLGPFTDKSPSQGINGYYLTAVDIAGKESSPSRIVYTNGRTTLPPFLTGGNLGGPGGVNFGGNGKGNGPGEAPSGGTFGGATGGNSAGGGAGGVPPVNSGTPTKPPSAPAGLKIKAQGAGIELSWNANLATDYAKEYNIYYSDKEKGPFKKLGTSTNMTQFHYYAANYGGFYKITAINAKGESAFSPTIQYKP
jgi:penicillin-binding protein